jgi:hypothetical protein
MMHEPTLCMTCVHFRKGPQRATPEGVNCCTAYPDGIPPEISSGRYDHRKEAPGDNGVRYEPRPDRPENVKVALSRFPS